METNQYDFADFKYSASWESSAAGNTAVHEYQIWDSVEAFSKFFLLEV